MSYRKQQVESTLLRSISGVLARQLSDPRIVGLISVTRVDVSADLRHATVYVSVLPENASSRAIHGLRHAAGYIHSLVCKAVAMKTVPHLDFRLDASLKKQAGVLRALREDRVGSSSVPGSEPLEEGVGRGQGGDGVEG